MNMAVLLNTQSKHSTFSLRTFHVQNYLQDTGPYELAPESNPGASKQTPLSPWNVTTSGLFDCAFDPITTRVLSPLHAMPTNTIIFQV